MLTRTSVALTLVALAGLVPAARGQTPVLKVDDATAAEPKAPPTGPRRIDHPEPEPVNLIDTAGAPVAQRLIPTIAAVVVLVLVIRWLRSRGD